MQHPCTTHAPLSVCYSDIGHKCCLILKVQCTLVHALHRCHSYITIAKTSGHTFLFLRHRSCIAATMAIAIHRELYNIVHAPLSVRHTNMHALKVL